MIIYRGRTHLKLEFDVGALERMRVPRKLWKTVYAKVPPACREAVQSYVGRMPEMLRELAGLYLWGPAGVGKSGIAALVIRRARTYCSTPLWVEAADLREAYRTKAPMDEEELLIDYARRADVLVIDDLTVEDAKDPVFGAHAFAQFIRHRHARGRMTCITSRLAPPDMEISFPEMPDAIKGALVGFPVVGEDQRELRQDYVALLVSPPEAPMGAPENTR